MKWVRNILYLLCILLLLQVIKTFLSKSGSASYYYWATIANCLQYLLISGLLLILPIAWLFKRKFSGKKRWLVSGITVLAIFTGLEFLFEFWLNHPEQIPAFLQKSYIYYYDNYDCRLIQFERGHSEYDSLLFYRLKTDAVFNYKNREFDNKFTTNSIGVRDDEQSLSAPEIICVGDSYIMGWGVNQDETVPQQLEKLSGMKTLNAGISSYGTVRELGLLNRVNTSSLKFLVIQYCGNDLWENESYQSNNYHLTVSPKKSFDFKQSEHAWVRRYFPGKYFFTIAPRFIKSRVNKIHPFFNLHLNRENAIKDENHQARIFLEVLYHAGINLEKTHVIVTMMDSYPHLHNDFLNQVKSLYDQGSYKEKIGKLSIVDPLSVLEENDFYKLDLHIKAAGHKKIAEKIFEIIKENP